MDDTIAVFMNDLTVVMTLCNDNLRGIVPLFSESDWLIIVIR